MVLIYKYPKHRKIMDANRRAFLKMTVGLGSMTAGLHAVDYFYSGWAPTNYEASRFRGPGAYPFAEPPLRLQSSYRGKINRVVVGSYSCPDETNALARVLSENFAPVELLTEMWAHKDALPRDSAGIYVRDHFLVTEAGDVLINPISTVTRRDVMHRVDDATAMISRNHMIRCAPFKFVGGQVIQADGRTYIPWAKDTAEQARFIIDSRPDFDMWERVLGAGTPKYDYTFKNSWMENEITRHFTEQEKRQYFGKDWDRVPGRLPEPEDLFRAYGLNCWSLPKFHGMRGHADMVLTPSDKKRLIVASNRMGLEIISSLTDGELEGYLGPATEHISKTSGKGEAREFRNAFLYLRQHREATAEGISIAADRFAYMNRKLDEMKERLPWDFSITEIPALIAPIITSQKHSIALAPNNALLERTVSSTAVVPTYGIGAFDRETLAVYGKEGFSVFPVNFTKTSLDCTGPHCCTLEFRDKSE